MNWRPFSVMKEHPAFLLQTKITLVSGFIFALLVIWLQYKIWKKCGFFSYYWFSLKSYYVILVMMAPIHLKNVQRIKDKVCREKLMVYLASTLSSRFFPTEILFLPVFVLVYMVIRLIVMNFWLPMNDKNSFLQSEYKWAHLLTSVESYWI